MHVGPLQPDRLPRGNRKLRIAQTREMTRIQLLHRLQLDIRGGKNRLRIVCKAAEQRGNQARRELQVGEALPGGQRLDAYLRHCERGRDRVHKRAMGYWSPPPPAAPPPAAPLPPPRPPGTPPLPTVVPGACFLGRGFRVSSMKKVQVLVTVLPFQSLAT